MNANEKSQRASPLKWIVASIIAFFGAGGGLVALLQYLDAKQEKANELYERQLAQWERFSPTSISRGDHEVEILPGWFIDLDLGQVSMSAVGGRWDLKYERKQTNFEGLRANDNVEWSPIGVVDFSALAYRDIRDAQYRKFRQGRNDKLLYFSHITAAPTKGYTFVVKTSANNVAKIQIMGYKVRANGTRKIALRYEVFPISADPPKPRQ